MLAYGKFFLYQDLVATTGARTPLRRPENLENRKNKRKKLTFHILIHTFAHTLLSAPGAMPPIRLSAT